jgi:hypothetical protein
MEFLVAVILAPALVIALIATVRSHRWPRIDGVLSLFVVGVAVIASLAVTGSWLPAFNLWLIVVPFAFEVAWVFSRWPWLGYILLVVPP